MIVFKHPITEDALDKSINRHPEIGKHIRIRIMSDWFNIELNEISIMFFSSVPSNPVGDVYYLDPVVIGILEYIALGLIEQGNRATYHEKVNLSPRPLVFNYDLRTVCSLAKNYHWIPKGFIAR